MSKPNPHDTSRRRSSARWALDLSIFAVLAVFAMSHVTYRVMGALGLDTDAASLFGSLLEASTAIVGAIFVAYQLGQANEDSARARDIEEASFLLELNKTFIENEDMVRVESDLENSWLGELDREQLVTDDNRQNFINYLVYLEGIAPFIIKGILRFETIDDLMAYRFYLAVNNPELQDDQLKKFPEYYRGCFKLYSMWTQYRRQNGYEIINEEHSLDRWSQFKRYSRERYDGLLTEIRAPRPEEYEAVGRLVFGTDPYIYPQAFGSAELAGRALAKVMAADEGVFSHRNILVATGGSNVIGILVFLDEGSIDRPYRREDFCDLSDDLPDTFEVVSRQYFSGELGEHTGSKGQLYIACLSVAEEHRGHGIAGALLDHALALNPHKTTTLDCLAGNKEALLLYRRHGFEVCEKTDGFTAKGRKPKVLSMLRRAQGA